MTRLHWPVILDRAKQIVNSYDGLITLRGLFYRLVSEELIPNEQAQYTYLSKKTAEGRRAGTFPDLLDRTRKIHQIRFWDGPEDALNDAASFYKRDRTAGQECNVYVGVEKEAMLGQIEAWYGYRGYPLLALKGYSSQTLADKVQRHADTDGRPAVLIYAGDLDPSGEDINRSFIERCGCFDEVVRIAVNYNQIKPFKLEKLGVKRYADGTPKDTRAAGFEERHGELFQVELEALDPNDLKDLFDATLDGYWDEDAYAAVLRQERYERQRLRDTKLAHPNPWTRRHR